MNTTEILADEAARQEQLAKARQHEHVRNIVTNLKRAIPHVKARLERYRKQLALFDDMDKLVGQMDGNIQGCNSFMARDQIIRQLCAARADQQRRVEQTEKDLAEKHQQLAKAETTVAEFE